MRNTNYCVVVGRIANEMNETNFRSVGNGTPLVTFSVAVNGSENVNGQWQDVASFFDVSYFGAGAGALRNFTGFGKGALVCVSGALKQRRWKDQNGNNRSAVEIVATSVEFLRAPNNAPQNAPNNGYPQNNGGYNAPNNGGNQPPQNGTTPQQYTGYGNQQPPQNNGYNANPNNGQSIQQQTMANGYGNYNDIPC